MPISCLFVRFKYLAGMSFKQSVPDVIRNSNRIVEGVAHLLSHDGVAFLRVRKLHSIFFVIVMSVPEFLRRGKRKNSKTENIHMLAHSNGALDCQASGSPQLRSN